jgi:ABC-type transport system involved in cytochrome bd biosynthesis fused ATPase/permease subunit
VTPRNPQTDALIRNPLFVDAAVAVVIVVLILIIQPGVAIGAILALVLLVVCGVSYLIGRRRERASAPGRQGRPAPRRRRRR